MTLGDLGTSEALKLMSIKQVPLEQYSKEQKAMTTLFRFTKR